MNLGNITFSIRLETFLNELFYHMESIQDGKHGHVVSFTMPLSLAHTITQHKDLCAERIARELTPFIARHLEEVKEVE